jgi:hypothetical protein
MSEAESYSFQRELKEEREKEREVRQALSGVREALRKIYTPPEKHGNTGILVRGARNNMEEHSLYDTLTINLRE